MRALWSDEPIDSDSDDLLDRGRFADRVADLVTTAGASGQSTVVGLVSPWGSGKTSLINLVEKRLRPPWRVARFTPWAASDINSLLSEFFTTIASALPEDKGRKARNALRACAQVSVPALAAVPYVGGLLKGAADKALGRFINEPPWDSRFRQASDHLRELGLPLLVIADDVDRLHSEELATLLKAVRLLGRFPGVHYLLAYDQATIIDVLRSSDIVRSSDDRALAFLEKIVQYPLAVPPVQQPQLDRLINAGLTGLLAENGRTLDEEETARLSLAYSELMTQTLTTVRSVQRYLAQARLYLPLLGPDEADIVDFLVLTHLRLHFPRLYDRLPAWRSELTGAFDPYRTSTSPRTDWDSRLADEGVPTRLVGAVRSVLEALFPAIGGIQVTIAGRRAKQRRVGDPDYFDRYFALGIPMDDVPDAMVDSALNEVAIRADGTDSNRLSALITGDDEARALRAIRKAVRLSEATPEPAAPALAQFAASLLPSVKDTPALIGDVRTVCIEWIARLLARHPPSEPEQQAESLVTAAGDVSAIAHALHRALGAVPNQPNHSPLRRMAARVADLARRVIIDNLAAGDDASRDPVMALTEFVADTGQLPVLVNEIEQGLHSGRWALDDVAARFVSIGRMIGGHDGWELTAFERERFLTAVPKAPSAAATLQLSEDPDRVDEHDVSWPNRRRVARQQLRLLAAVEGQTEA